ncbi:MAG: DUF1761 domain-containing protein [Tabrizicola sp.]|nr:DUF1761 domain-containing protein [Tabrizicola sp.]
MPMEFVEVNWLAVIVGAAVAFGLSFLWFGPLFGRAWAAGSHNITRPERMPLLALACYGAGTLALAVVVGVTATTDSLLTAVAAIVGTAALLFSLGLFSQKTAGAALIDAGAILVMGAVMILAQGLF